MSNGLIDKNILIIVENLPLPFDRRVWQEAISLKSNGANVIIICPTGEGYVARYELIDGIHIYRHPLPAEGNDAIGYFIEYSVALFWQIILAIKVFFMHGIDIIQICNPPDLIFISTLPFKLMGKKIVFDHHDINPELFIAKFGKKNIFYYMMIIFERITFKLADISIATNNSYRDIAISRGKMRSDKVFVVRSGPILEWLKIQPPKEKLKNGKKYLISYVGVIGQQEGLDHLLEVATILIEKFNFKDFYMIICGSGPALPELKEYCIELNINDYVEFSGRISDPQLLEVLNTADVCVNPDVWNEMNDKSTMNKIMEYMALKKPIVQYDLKEGKYSSQDASFYAEPNNREDFALKILTLLKDKKLRQQMGEYGYKRVKNKLSWAVEEPKLIQAYHSLF